MRRDRQIAERPGVGDDAHFRRRFELVPEHVVAGLREIRAAQATARGDVKACESLRRTIAEQPAALVVEAPALNLKSGRSNTTAPVASSER